MAFKIVLLPELFVPVKRVNGARSRCAFLNILKFPSRNCVIFIVVFTVSVVLHGVPNPSNNSNQRVELSQHEKKNRLLLAQANNDTYNPRVIRGALV
jgi:hypothetical protein